jgi:hypothetical protein
MISILIHDMIYVIVIHFFVCLTRVLAKTAPWFILGKAVQSMKFIHNFIGLWHWAGFVLSYLGVK